MNELANELGRYYAVWQEFNYVYAEWAKERGMSVNSLLVICAIDSGDRTQKMISQRWMIPKQTVNMVFKDLEGRGLVAQSRSDDDRRSKVIEFTDEGRKYADEIVSELREKELAVLRKFGIDRMKRLNDDLECFVRLFGNGATDGEK